MDWGEIGEIADKPERFVRKPTPKPAQSEKICRVCSKGITKDNTPSIFYYSKFCSNKCKEKYVYSTDL
ncbi:MAG: hypothetical protein NUV57_05850 [archaeon]|nr:hypothetical protein [archaeon]